MNNTYSRAITVLLLLLFSTLFTGCATYGPLLDSISDPRIMNIIDTVRDLVDAYRLRLADPALLGIERSVTAENFEQLAADIEVQLQILESYGYTRAADHWRARMNLPPDGHS